MNNCEYCSKEFSSKSALNIHQKTAKYCLQLQEKSIEEIETFICNFCSKEFTLKSTLLKHIERCKNNNKKQTISELDIYIEENKKLKEERLIKNEKIKSYKETIIKLEAKIEKLENTIAKIAAKPRTTNNTVNNQRYNQIIQNLSPITQETLDELPYKLEDRHISQGPYGYVVFVLENLQDKLVCTDIARKKLTFKDEKNNIITDINGRQITYKIFKSIHELRENLVEIKKSKAKTELEKTQAVLYYGAEDAAIGKFLNMQEESVFSNKFISELSSKFYIKNIPICKDNDIEYLVLSDG
jgi:hypothetical protein